MDYSVYEAYEAGFENGKQFAYVPDLNGVNEVKAYSMGLNDSKGNIQKKTFDELENVLQTK